MRDRLNSNNQAAVITRYALVLLGFVLLFLLLYTVRYFLAIVYVSLIIAATLHPITVYLQRWMPRAAAVLAIYLGLAAVIVLIGLLILPSAIVQLGSFLAALPAQAGEVRSFLSSIDYWLAQAGVDINLTVIVEQTRSQFVALALRLVGVPLLLYEFIASIITVVALSFYWLLDRNRLLNSVFSLLPADRRERARKMYLRSEELLGSFVRGLLLASVILGTVTYVALLILGVPFPLLLALIAAVLEVIPIIGPIIAAFPIVGVAFAKSFGLGIITLILWIIVQILEGNVLTPVIQRHTVRLAPFTILFALLLGGALLGILGALLAIPTAVLIGIVLRELSLPNQDRSNKDDKDDNKGSAS